ncbi:MAG: hypothetical protein QNJ91_12745 [Gammaproteobacteria bacterium]|nr:hypothetical protein [Gammaproteobacteria bacterium]
MDFVYGRGITEAMKDSVPTDGTDRGSFSLYRFLCNQLSTRRFRGTLARSASSGPRVRNVFAATLGALLCAVSHAATVPVLEFSVPKEWGKGTQWICQTELRDEIWYMRCDNMAEVFSFDPVLGDTDDSPRSTLIPIYGAPFADSPLQYLATSVLCRRNRACNVVVSDWPRRVQPACRAGTRRDCDSRRRRSARSERHSRLSARHE